MPCVGDIVKWTKTLSCNLSAAGSNPAVTSRGHGTNAPFVQRIGYEATNFKIVVRFHYGVPKVVNAHRLIKGKHLTYAKQSV